MTIAFDTERPKQENIDALGVLLDVARTTVAPDFVLRSFTAQPSGCLPDIAGVVSEVTAYGPQVEVDLEMGVDQLYYFAERCGQGHTTTIREYRGQEAANMAIRYAQFNLNALKV